MRRRLVLASLSAVLTVPSVAAAHAPSVIETDTAGPADAIVLDDPTLSRAIGATIEEPGEIDWYRLDLRAGDPLVVGTTAPDAVGAIATTFTLLGPGLPDAASAGPDTAALARELGVDGAIAFEPATEPRREVHAGLGFINYGSLRLEAPQDGSYWVALRAVDPDATGKYVFAPGLREEFGVGAIGGMVDLVGFFNAPWPPAG